MPPKVPLVAVVMAVRNTRRFVVETVGSVLGQTVADFEFVVVDDGSTDGTRRLLRRLAREDERMVVLERPKRGLSASLNEACAVTRAPIIARMDGDDIALPGRLESQLAYMEKNPDCVLLGTSVGLIDPHGLPLGELRRPTEHAQINAQLLLGEGGVIVHPTAVMRRSAFEAVGGYNSRFDDSEDLDLFLRLGEIGRLANLPEIHLLYRRRVDSVTHRRRPRQLQLKSQILAEAYVRRGLPVPEAWTFSTWSPPVAHELLKMWGWRALKGGHTRQARRMALSLLRRRPAWIESWRLLYCSLRGR